MIVRDKVLLFILLLCFCYWSGDRQSDFQSMDIVVVGSIYRHWLRFAVPMSADASDSVG